jgi:hypothetical protein
MQTPSHLARQKLHPHQDLLLRATKVRNTSALSSLIKRIGPQHCACREWAPHRGSSRSRPLHIAPIASSNSLYDLNDLVKACGQVIGFS